MSMHWNDFTNYHPYRLTTKQRRFIKHWEKRRQIPRWKYLVFYGVLREGLIFFFLIKLIQFLFDSNSFSSLYTSVGGVLFLIFEIFFWLGGGLVVGWFKHRSFETEYEMLKSMEHY
jgi:hypothetical protein